MVRVEVPPIAAQLAVVERTVLPPAAMVLAENCSVTPEGMPEILSLIGAVNPYKAAVLRRT